jgi:hypothetical protein
LISKVSKPPPATAADRASKFQKFLEEERNLLKPEISKVSKPPAVTEAGQASKVSISKVSKVFRKERELLKS